jgi:hypothetical protein
MPGKRVQFDDDTWNALDLLAKDSMRDFQELADEAFADLLRKHGRPADLKTALRQSAGSRHDRQPHRCRVATREGLTRASEATIYGWRRSETMQRPLVVNRARAASRVRCADARGVVERHIGLGGLDAAELGSFP